MLRHRIVLGLTLALAGPPALLAAQSDSTSSASRSEGRDTTRTSRDNGDARENQVRRQRRGAGIRIGSWQVSSLSTVSGSTTSTLPAFEGYWQRGLDRHVVLETSAGLWTRSQRSSSETMGSYIIPMLTSVKVYPATDPGAALEPFVMGGVGFTLGIDDRNSAGAGGVLGGSSTGGGTLLVPGIGLKAGGGVEYHLGEAFGVAAQAGYQFIRFFQDVANDRTYRGMQVFAGVTYRFQF